MPDVALGPADLDEGVLSAGNGALDEHEVLLLVDANQLEVLDCDALVSHMAGHVQALAHAGGIGTLADGAGLTLVARTMCHGSTGEVPTLDGALKTLALRGTDDIDGLDLCEVRDRDRVARRNTLRSRP